MASITVTSSGYWGDDGILASGSWSGLVAGDTVNLNGYTVTIDPAQQTPTGIDKATVQNITNANSKLILNNTSTTAALKLYGYASGDMDVQNFGTLQVTGGFIVLQDSGGDWASDGSADQTIPGGSYGWPGAGFDVADYCCGIEIEEDTNVWVKWSALLSGDAFALSDIGVGDLGRFFIYNASTGEITFGDGGKPTDLSSNAAAGQKVVNVDDASDFSADDVVHLVRADGTMERNEIASINTNEITMKYDLLTAFNTADGAFLRLTAGGKIPPTGARVRVPNCLIGAMNGSYVIQNPTTTASASCFEIDTSSSGIISIDKCILGGVYANFLNAQNVSLTNVCFYRKILISAPAVSPTLENLSHSSDPFTTADEEAIDILVARWTITDSRIVVEDANLGTIDAYSVCTNISVLNTYLQLLDMSYSAYNSMMLSSNAVVDFNGCDLIGYTNSTYTSGRMEIKNSRFSMSKTGKSDKNVAVVSSGFLIENCSSIPEGFLGTNTTLFSTVNAIGVDIQVSPVWGTTSRVFNGPVAADMVLKNVFTDRFPTNLNMYTTNSAHGSVLMQNARAHHDDMPLLITSWAKPNNALFKQVSLPSGDIDTGTYLGCHFVDGVYDYANAYGLIGLLWGSITSNDPDAYETSGDVLLTGSRLYITSDGGSITYTFPHRIMGHEFRNVAPTLDGSGYGNFTVQFSVNGGSWQNFTAANLYAANYTGMMSGFSFAIKITRTTGSKTEYIDELWAATSVDFDNYPYPVDTVNITLQNIKDGSRYYVFNQTTSTQIATGVQSGSADIIIPDVPYNGSNETLLIRVRKGGGGSTDYKPFETNATLTATGATVWISQVLDDLTT